VSERAEHKVREGEEPESVLAVLQKVKAGEVDPRNLSAESRQACVEHMSVEGYATAEMAQVLRVTERTVRRDRQAIRKAHAVQPGDEFVKETVGALVAHAEMAIDRIRRQARSRELSPMERVHAERLAWRIRDELAERLQKLGYLPTAATEVKGAFTHELTGRGLAPTYNEITVQIEQLEAVVKDSRDVPPEVAGKLMRLKALLPRCQVADELESLAEGIENGKESIHDDTGQGTESEDPGPPTRGE
jgi:transposase-like protein